MASLTEIIVAVIKEWMNMERGWNKNDGQIPKYLVKNLSHCLFVHQEFYFFTNVSSMSMWITHPPIQWAPRCFLGK